MRTSNNCIYNLKRCKATVGSEEHTILQSLGGRRASTNICCQNCNNDLGAEIDAPFASRFAQLCTLIGVKQQRKNTPFVVKGLYENQGFTYNLTKAGLKPSRYPPPKIEMLNENIENIEICHADEESALKIFDRIMLARSRKGAEIKSVDVEHIYSVVECKEVWDFNFSTGDLRSIAKMLLTELSKCIRPNRLRSNMFNDVIHFVNGITLDDSKFLRPIYKHNLPFKNELGIFQHSAYIRLVPGVGCLGVLNLFDTFSFGVVLSTDWDGPDYLHIHMVNPTDGKVKNCKFEEFSTLDFNDWQSWLLPPHELKQWEAEPLFFQKSEIQKFVLLAKKFESSEL